MKFIAELPEDERTYYELHKTSFWITVLIGSILGWYASGVILGVEKCRRENVHGWGSYSGCLVSENGKK